MNEYYRLIGSCLLLISAFIYIHLFPEINNILAREKLGNFPDKVGKWVAEKDNYLSDQILRILRVTDYLDKDFRGSDNRTINLYIGYFENQKQGQIIHSPKHCFPGSGWKEKRYEDQWVPLKGRDRGGILINKYEVIKGSEKYMVLYWYQSRGRVIRNEYIDRIYLVWDAIVKNRTDGSLVRIIARLKSSDEEEDLNAAIDFIQNLMPIIALYIPS